MDPTAKPLQDLSPRLTATAFIVSLCITIIYSVAIAIFIAPAFGEWLFIIALPSAIFVVLDLLAVYILARPLQPGTQTSNAIASDRINRVQFRLSIIIIPVFVVTTIAIHLALTLIDEGWRVNFVDDPDFWSLLINQVSLFTLILLTQSFLFDRHFSKARFQLQVTELPPDDGHIGIFVRITMMMVTMVLLLGSSISIYTTLSMDEIMHREMISLSLDQREFDTPEQGVRAYYTELVAEKKKLEGAIAHYDSIIGRVKQVLDHEDLDEATLEWVQDFVSDKTDELLQVRILEEGLDLHVAIVFIFMTMAAAGSILLGFVFSKLFNIQLGMIRDKTRAMLSSKESLSDRLYVTTMDETAMLISDFNQVLSYNERVSVAYGHFVPYEFLSMLDKESILDVGLGDQTSRVMTVLFADIRGFTAMSEAMRPEETFEFINTYLSFVGPVIRAHNGFIDKYIGDAVMALFPASADDAAVAAFEMLEQVEAFNRQRLTEGKQTISIGIGFHTGPLMLGTVGEQARMDGTVLSDAVNIASRLEGLTKHYDASIITSDATVRNFSDRLQCDMAFLDEVTVEGRTRPIKVFSLAR